MLRRVLTLSLLALVVAPLAGRAAQVRALGAEVVAVQPTRVADLVVLGGGFEAGLREGMVCRVTRGTTAVAEVQLVGLRSHCSAALILSLTPGQSIRAGDLASVKILKT